MTSGQTARFNWILVAVLSALAAAMGVAPAAWLAHYPHAALWFGAGAAALALLAPRKLTRPLTLIEYTFEFEKMLAFAALIGAVWMFLYGSLSGVVELVLRLRISPWLRNPNLVTFVGSVVIAAVLGSLMELGLWDDVHKRMALPSDGGAAWYWVTKMDVGRLITVLVADGLLAVLFWFVWRPGLLVSAELGLFFFFAQFDTVPGPPPVDVIGRLFWACGYSVTLEPRIGDEKIDGFLKPIDLFAEGKTSSFAVRVVTPDGGSPPVDWTVGSSLRTAASLYASKPQQVRCMVVLLGKYGDPSLKDFAELEDVQVFQFPDGEIVRRAAATDEQEKLRKLAEQYLHLQPEPARVEARS